MIKSIEMTGRTEDDAIAAALQQLGKSRDDVSVEVLERAKSGFLGIGGSPARVRVSYEDRDPRLQQLEEFLTGLFERMDVQADINALMSDDESTIQVELTGDHVGTLIGRRGETLDAIQHLSNYVLNNGRSERIRVNIDAENYRAKRAEALSRLANKVAAKVVKYRRNVTLEPMNAYERHVIHTALQEYSGVTTYSTGTEPNRRVVVAYERPAQPPRRDGGSRPAQRRSAPQPAPQAPQPPQERPEPQIPSADNNAREWR